ncbi:BTAD domain-containing putative transcriptional regulator [Kitasatospora sp. NPDC001664]
MTGQADGQAGGQADGRADGRAGERADGQADRGQDRPPVLLRERLLDRVLPRPADAGRSPLALLVAPAGFGKSTLLAQAADRAGPGTRVVRWQPCRGTTGTDSLLSALGRQLPESGGTVEGFLRACGGRGRPVLLLVDDLHQVHGTPAEAAVEELALLAPPGLRVVAAGRRRPLINLTRRELAGTTVLGPAELRFGPAETARLHVATEHGPAAAADGHTTAPDELAAGWPAALLLLGGAPRPGPLARAYLDREVLAPLPAALRSFLAQVSALPVLTPERCDAVTGRTDSDWLLAELTEDRALLTPDGRWVAPLLRLHLQGHLAPAPTLPATTLRCFGGFQLGRDGRLLDWGLTRPRARALLRILAIQPNRPVHREILMESLWPGRPPAAAGRSLQVAVSSLRALLEPGAARGTPQLLQRLGEAYQLRVPDQWSCDVRQFDQAVAQGGRAGLRRALSTYTGDLLPEDGPAEWVVERREHYRREAAEAALALTRLELLDGAPAAAAQTAARSLEIDPFREEAWQLLITAHRRNGDPAAAARSRLGHARMLHSLGLPPAAP